MSAMDARTLRHVAPRVGAWIEIAMAEWAEANEKLVAPRVGAWIEIKARPWDRRRKWSGLSHESNSTYAQPLIFIMRIK